MRRQNDLKPLYFLGAPLFNQNLFRPESRAARIMLRPLSAGRHTGDSSNPAASPSAISPAFAVEFCKS
jgi:hypothetical protein